MHHHHLTMLDIETVPDRETIPERLLRQMEQDPKFFPPLPFHPVVAVSIVQAEIHRPPERRSEWFKVLGVKSQSGPERGILDRFWQGYVPKVRPRFVTWNGRGFDFPVLLFTYGPG
jgi:predicted PolB exonuclease-like 3'-5' exonuclease